MIVGIVIFIVIVTGIGIGIGIPMGIAGYRWIPMGILMDIPMGIPRAIQAYSQGRGVAPKG